MWCFPSISSMFQQENLRLPSPWHIVGEAQGQQGLGRNDALQSQLPHGLPQLNKKLWKMTILLGKITISMPIFNSKLFTKG